MGGFRTERPRRRQWRAAMRGGYVNDSFDASGLNAPSINQRRHARASSRCAILKRAAKLFASCQRATDCRAVLMLRAGAATIFGERVAGDVAVAVVWGTRQPNPAPLRLFGLRPCPVFV